VRIGLGAASASHAGRSDSAGSSPFRPARGGEVEGNRRLRSVPSCQPTSTETCASACEFLSPWSWSPTSIRSAVSASVMPMRAAWVMWVNTLHEGTRLR